MPFKRSSMTQIVFRCTRKRFITKLNLSKIYFFVISKKDLYYIAVIVSLYITAVIVVIFSSVFAYMKDCFFIIYLKKTKSMYGEINK